MIRTSLLGLSLLGSTFMSASWLGIATSASADSRSLIERSLLDSIDWGASPAQVRRYWSNRIRREYDEPLRAAIDTVVQDHIYQQMRNDLQALDREYIAFRGKRTGWEHTFLRLEFRHNNQESMLVVRRKSEKLFFFFYRESLWKVFRATPLNEGFSRFQQGYVDLLSAKKWQRSKEEGTWSDGLRTLRTVDAADLFGTYGVGLAHSSYGPSREGAIPAARSTVASLVDHVTQDDVSDHDRHSHIVDRITGVIRD